MDDAEKTAKEYDNSSEPYFELVWDGYEECHFEIRFESDETDNEYAERIIEEERKKREEENRKEQERIKNEKLKEYNELIDKANKINEELRWL